MYQQDWVLRQIQILVQVIARLFFKKETVEYRVDSYGNYSAADYLYFEIERLVLDFNVCQAENLLYERMDVTDMKYLELAIDFYQKISRLSDEELEVSGFSRQEIYAGMNDVMRLFGLPKLPI